MERKVTPEREGRDPLTTLLLPGMSLNETIFPRLAGTVIAPDFNGLVLGMDGAGTSVSQHRMDLYVRMLRDFLQAEPRWSVAPQIVVGHSFGGMLAMQWLLTEPDAQRGVTGLVLVATTAGPMFDRVRLSLGTLGGRRVRVPLKPLLPFWNGPRVTRAVKRLVCGDTRVERVDFRQLPDPTDVALDLAGWRNTDWRAMRSYRIAMEGFDVRDRLPGLTVPTIVLHGTRDTVFPVGVARELASLLPNAELRVVRGAGHGLPLTHGAWVREAVEDLID